MRLSDLETFGVRQRAVVEAAVLRINNRSETGRAVHRSINWRALCQRLADGDTVYMVVDSIDCDGVRSIYLDEVDIRAGLFVGLTRWSIELWRCVEGPTSYWPITAREAAEFAPWRRDLGAEAFEDGRPHLISSATVH